MRTYLATYALGPSARVGNQVIFIFWGSIFADEDTDFVQNEKRSGENELCEDVRWSHDSSNDKDRHDPITLSRINVAVSILNRVRKKERIGISKNKPKTKISKVTNLRYSRMA